MGSMSSFHPGYAQFFLDMMNKGLDKLNSSVYDEGPEDEWFTEYFLGDYKYGQYLFLRLEDERGVIDLYPEGSEQEVCRVPVRLVNGVWVLEAIDPGVFG